MTKLSDEAIFEIEERRIALEEQKEENRSLEAKRTHELALSKMGAAIGAQGTETSSKVSISMIAVLSSVIGGISSFGAAYVAGLFDIQNTNVVAQSNFDLERQKFANNLISNALEEESDRERALRLMFMVDIGLFDTELKPEIIRQYAAAEAERIEQGSQGESLLPSPSGASIGSVDFFFLSDHPTVTVFRSEAGISEMRKAGALASRELLATILANFFYETGGFRSLEENGNYSAATLQRVFPRQYSNRTEAQKDERNPKAILNKVYGNRLGNIAKNDGWKFRGRGYLRITGKAIYEKVGAGAGLDLVSNPDIVSEPEIALKIALSHLNSSGAMEMASKGDISGAREKLNGGLYGLSHLETLHQAFLEAFHQHRDHPLVKLLPEND